MLNTNKVPMKREKIEPLDPGTYPARLVVVADLGVQTQADWQGEARPPTNKVAFSYEFVDEFLKGEDGKPLTDKPRWLTETMPIHNLLAAKAKSTARYRAFDSEGKFAGDFAKAIGVPVMVTIVHNPNKKVPGEVWENIKEVSAMRKKDAEKCPALVNKAVVFDLDNPSFDAFTALPKFLQRMIVQGVGFADTKFAAQLAAKNYTVSDEPASQKGEEAVADTDVNPY